MKDELRIHSLWRYEPVEHTITEPLNFNPLRYCCQKNSEEYNALIRLHTLNALQTSGTSSLQSTTTNISCARESISSYTAPEFSVIRRFKFLLSKILSENRKSILLAPSPLSCSVMATWLPVILLVVLLCHCAIAKCNDRELKLVTRYAPILHLHPSEQYFPSSMEWYLAQCSIYDADDQLVVSSQSFLTKLEPVIIRINESIASILITDIDVIRFRQRTLLSISAMGTTHPQQIIRMGGTWSQ